MTVQLMFSSKIMTMFILLRIFPCSKFIINIREDIESQSKSQWYAQYDSIKDIGRHNWIMKVLFDYLGPQQSRQMTLEDWSTNSLKLDEMAEWLGFQDCSFVVYQDVLQKGYESGWLPEIRKNTNPKVQYYEI